MAEVTEQQPAPVEQESKPVGEESKPSTPEAKEIQIVQSQTSNEDAEKTSTFSEDYDPNDPKNPKNWSTMRKHLIFAALMSSSILCDGYVSAIVLPRLSQSQLCFIQLT